MDYAEAVDKQIRTVSTISALNIKSLTIVPQWIAGSFALVILRHLPLAGNRERISVLTHLKFILLLFKVQVEFLQQCANIAKAIAGKKIEEG